MTAWNRLLMNYRLLHPEFSSTFGELGDAGFVCDTYVKHLDKHWTAVSVGAR